MLTLALPRTLTLALPLGRSVTSLAELFFPFPYVTLYHNLLEFQIVVHPYMAQICSDVPF